MVVLEAGGSMVTIGNTQYLQPDYLSPLSTSLDAKKSPLALLAQTCSQIGADSSVVKPSLVSDKNKLKSETSKSPSTISKTPKSNTSPQEIRPLAFKPYEINVLTKSSLSSSSSSTSTSSLTAADDRPSSKSSSVNGSVCDEKLRVNMNCARVPSRNNSHHNIDNNNHTNNNRENGKHTPNASDNNNSNKSMSPDGLSQRGASPIIRSGMEVLHGSPKLAMNPSLAAALCCPPGMEQHLANPAFRPPYGGGFSPHHAAMLAAAGYSPNGATNPAMYMHYNQHMMLGGAGQCPSGCTGCEQQKYGLAMAMSGLPPNHPYVQMSRPYMCTWVVGDAYCGKRCANSDELIQHLRTHTPNLTDPAATAVLLQAQQQQQQMMHPAFGALFTTPSMHRTGYATPPLSPMSAAARYHPYGKPGAPMPSAMQPSPYATFNPASLSAYYSPYAMYSQRLGAAATHQ